MTKIEIKLPTWAEIAQKEEKDLSKLELFIFNNEPADTGFTEEFRQELLDALNEVVDNENLRKILR